ncbi:hypothetical protein EDD76_105106 [Kineothrix alysoides]|uniref:Uncharacterized protein n=1 Tax=Kineothrix alysoides TaxID=1469948 RepID=A0A4R1R0V3_9FIRM|nr:hypothetical protein [Kineothrix alysoides]TCL58934.1 hypothetical protein EDD76_105106 [Kineothrix alysoides]
MGIMKKQSCKELFLFFEVGFAAYWFANAVLWIPWKINQGLGITVMILLVPFLWGASSVFCLRHTPIENWKKAKYVIAMVFLFVGVISDAFFFAVWRGIPEELYRPTTFAAYALIIIVPIIIGIVFSKAKEKKAKLISSKSLFIIGVLGILFLTATLYTVQYW